MIQLARLLRDPVVLRFGLALVHFLWQGTALALLAVLVLLCLKRTRPAVRYLALLAVLAAMVAAPVMTFSLSSQAPVLAQPSAPVMVPPPLALTARPAPAEERHLGAWAPAAKEARAARPSEALVGSLRTKLMAAWAWVTRHAALLALGWVVGVSLLSLRLLWRWVAAARARGRAAALGDERWEQMVLSVAQRLRVRAAVQLLQSALVHVPTVVGWLKPAILLPASVLTGLAPEQLEAVLAHELAHIRRRDYLVNIFQSVIEVLLFYHPAVWWVSHRIRVEREHCCDDVAVAACGSVTTYSRALTELERLRTPMLDLVVAASGTPLLERIRRLVVRQEVRVAVPSWVSATIPVLAVVALVAVPWSAAAPTPVAERKAAAAARTPATPAGPAGMLAVCTAPGDQVGPDVSGDIVVWTDYRNNPGGRRRWVDDSEVDILGYDLRKKHEFAICDQPGVQEDAAIDGSIVVWSDFRNDPDGRMTWDGEDNADTYCLDLATGKEFPICLAPGNQTSPRISDDLVVWADERARPSTGVDIWGCNLRDGREFPICTARGDQNAPDVSGTVVVWEDYRNDSDGQRSENQPDNPDMYGRDLAGGPEFPICTHYSFQVEPTVSGKTVVWTDGRSASEEGKPTGASNPDIYGYDLAQRREFSISTARGNQYIPAISGNRVVYVSTEQRVSLVIYDLATGSASYLMNLRESYEPAISGDTVVWLDHRDEAKSGLNIYGYRLPKTASTE